VRLVGEPFSDPYLFLFLGGMLIGAAMERHNLHRRIALTVIRAVGANPRSLLLGFILSTASISLFISNTATAVMMVPIAMAVVSQIEEREGRPLPMFGQAVMLSIAYAANVGGIGTLIGTAPNGVFARFARAEYGVEMGFLHYLKVGLPFVALFLPVVFAALAFLCRKERIVTFTRDIVSQELAKLGRMSRPEKIVLWTFLAACALWISNEWARAALGLASPGEAHINSPQFDALVALAAGTFLFALGIVDRSGLKRLSWDALILLGGSFALAMVVQKSGLSDWMARYLRQLSDLPPFLLVLSIMTLTVFLSAFSSNTATATIMMQLVSNALDPGRAAGGRVVPILSGVSIAASCDFMLPAGTPPNAVVFGTRRVRMRTMVTTGAVLDAAAAVVSALWVYFGVTALLG
jgi:sodium-dependent dicarboxylate transporter 2/3/5